jgi:phospholipase C
MGGTQLGTGPGRPSSQENELSPQGMSRKRRRRLFAGGLVVGLTATILGFAGAFANPSHAGSAGEASTTPIKHLVVIYQENVSFDHYFGTYPNAVNSPGEPSFYAKPDTPSVNGLTPVLLEHNPNSSNPKRLSRSEALTCDMDHGYGDEQKAFDGGLMDKFVQYTAGGGCTDKSLVMDYYDGNTVTGLWNLAQNFAMSDNSFSTQFGPSTPGAINLISGETHGAVGNSGAIENETDIGDADPKFDDCSAGNTISMTGRNVGDLLNEKGVTWGWFQGGFAPTSYKEGKAVCASSHKNVGGATDTDYSPHHNPFEYYESTANPHHLPPSSESMIGHSDQANHEYDVSDFDEAVRNENLPAVSFVKAAEYQDGHAGYSDPLDEQAFIAEKLDELEHSKQWSSTAVVIAYDDSDGWYDHVMSPIVNHSQSKSDWLTGEGKCGEVAAGSDGIQDRCGYGPRQPLLVISPYAKQNYVAHTVSDQSSITKFIEENWGLPAVSSTSMDNVAGTLDDMFEFGPGAGKAPKVFLDPENGEVVGSDPGEDGHGHNGHGRGHGHGH